MPKYKKSKVKAVKALKLGAAALPKPSKGKVYLRDANDRFFTLETDGVNLELKAGVLTEVDKKVANFLKGKYSYLEIIK